MIRQFRRLKIQRLFAALFLITLSSGVSHVSAASSQGFQILSGQADQGMIMSQTRNPDVVEPTNDGNLSSMVGVVSPNQSNFDESSSNNINVQTDGETQVLVSTLNGNLLVGDKITGSPVQGIGAKLNGSGWIVATAEGSLDSSTRGAVQSSVVDSKGVKRTVYVALIPAVVHVTYYSSSANSASQSLQNFANNLAGKKVSLQIIILSVLLFITGLVAAGVIIVSAVRSGFLAISRQPLSKFVIVREQWRSFATAIAILLFVSGGCVLLLRFL